MPIYLARIGVDQSGHQRDEGGLAGAGKSENGDKFAAADRQVDRFQHLGADTATVGVALGDVAKLKNGNHDVISPRFRCRHCGWRSPGAGASSGRAGRSEEHTSELQSLMRISYAVFCLKTKKTQKY